MADNIITFLGTEPVYFPQEKHLVGTIREKALPARLLTYKAFLSLEPPGDVNPFIGQSFGLGSFGLLGGASRFTSTVLTGSSPVFFTIDFVQSNPVLNQIIKVKKSDIVDDNTINFGAFPLKVGYMMEVTLINEADGLRLSNIASVVRKGQSDIAINGDINLLPQPEASREDDYFDYYQLWSGSAIFPGVSELEKAKIDKYKPYNVYDSKVPTEAQNYTDHRFNSQVGTDSNLVKLKDGATADKIYIVTYDEITDWLFSERVDITVRSESFVIGDINAFSSASAQKYFISRYTYQSFQAKTDDPAVGGENLKGWRLTETFKGNINGVVLKNQTRPFDADENPIVGFKRNPEHAFMNMVEENMRLFTDTERIGYDAGLLATYNAASSESQVVSSPGNGKTNALDSPSLITSNNWSAIEIAQRTIADYDPNINGSHLLFEPGSAAGIIALAGEVNFDGAFTSPLYIRNFPRRTRMVLPSEFGVEVLGVVLKSRETGQRFATEDPTYMAAINGNLTSMNFVDSHYHIALGYQQTEGESYRAKQFASSPHLGQGNDFNPGQPIILSEYTYLTNIDDTSVTSSPSPKNQVVAEFPLIVNGSASGIAEIGVSGTLFNVSSDLNIATISISITSESDILLVRGWESKPDNVGFPLDFSDKKPKYEQSGIRVFNGKAVVQVNSWTSINFIEVIGEGLIATIEKLGVIEAPDNLILNNVKSVMVTSDSRGRLLAFYTNEEEALSVLTSIDDGKNFKQLTNILMRGDRIEAISGIVNRSSNDRYYLFHFFRGALLMVPFTTSLFCIETNDISKQTEILDSIRRQYCYLIWGNISDSNISESLISTTEEYEAYLAEYPSVNEILSSDDFEPTEKDLSDGNRFILYNENEENDLTETNPVGQDYAVYQNNKQVIRLVIKTEENFRMIISTDEGQSWRDCWRHIAETQTVNIDKSKEVIRLNYLSAAGVDSEEGTNISIIYDKTFDRAFMFFFYEGVLFNKIVNDAILDEDFDTISSSINNLSALAVAGNLVNVESEQKTSDNPNGLVEFNNFQQNEDNYKKYYSTTIYEDQKVSGYATENGYIRLFIQNNKNGGIDSYFYNGRDWVPEHVLVSKG